jgi:hypothetical protein
MSECYDRKDHEGKTSAWPSTRTRMRSASIFFPYPRYEEKFQRMRWVPLKNTGIHTLVSHEYDTS